MVSPPRAIAKAPNKRLPTARCNAPTLQTFEIDKLPAAAGLRSYPPRLFLASPAPSWHWYRHGCTGPPPSASRPPPPASCARLPPTQKAQPAVRAYTHRKRSLNASAPEAMSSLSEITEPIHQSPTHRPIHTNKTGLPCHTLFGLVNVIHASTCGKIL